MRYVASRKITMRNNDRKYTSKKLVVSNTPLSRKLITAHVSNLTVTVDGLEQKVVDFSIVKGREITEFFLLKNRTTTQGK